MKKLGFFLLFCFVSTSSVFCQKGKQHEFIGTIQLLDKSLITYKLVFKETGDGNIEGRSISDFAGAHRTESRIKGKMDPDNKKISFSEYENISTKSDYPDSTFCYVHIYNAKLTLKKNKSVIQGHFYSRYTDGALCVEGDLYLAGQDQLFAKMDKATKRAKIFVKDEKLAKADKYITETKANLKDVYLKEDDQLNFKTKSRMVYLKIWDAEHEDGDRISVYQNDKVILDNYKVVKEPKMLLITIDQQTEDIKIVANNEGRIPPNSANIAVIDNKDLTPMKVALNKGKEVTLKFQKIDD